MILYGIPTCDTCKKALKAIENAGKSVTFRDVRKDPLSEDEIARLVHEFGDRIINKTSTTYRGFNDFLKMSEPEAQIAAQPAVMKRPVIEDDGRWPMRPGDIAVWPKGSTNGHHLINESDADCVFVALGGGKKYDTGGGYSDIDMLFGPDGYFHKDGTPYPTSRIP